MSGEAPVAVVAGVGSGTGEALVRRFADGGYRVAMIARKVERLERIAGDVANAVGYRCDMADVDGFRDTLNKIKQEMGSPKVAIMNGARRCASATIRSTLWSSRAPSGQRDRPIGTHQETCPDRT